MAQEEQVIENLKKLLFEFEAEKAFARGEEYIGDFGAYTKLFITKRDNLENQLSLLQRKIMQVRDVISDMFKEQKTYEIVDENRKNREQKEEEQKNQQLLDEIGTNNYIKNKHS